MDRETFQDYFNVSPETYARRGWDMGRILGDLKRENGSTPGGWGAVANAAAALLEELGFGPTAPAAAMEIDTVTLTTAHSASSYGIPVLVIDGEVYGPGDMTPAGILGAELVQAWTARFCRTGRGAR